MLPGPCRTDGILGVHGIRQDDIDDLHVLVFAYAIKIFVIVDRVRWDRVARDAINAGVDSIEHGSFLKPETLALMKTKNVPLVPTLMAAAWVNSQAEKYPPEIQEKARAATNARGEMFRNAVKAGVNIAFGTDAGVFPHGTTRRSSLS